MHLHWWERIIFRIFSCNKFWCWLCWPHKTIQEVLHLSLFSENVAICIIWSILHLFLSFQTFPRPFWNTWSYSRKIPYPYFSHNIKIPFLWKSSSTSCPIWKLFSTIKILFHCNTLTWRLFLCPHPSYQWCWSSV